MLKRRILASSMASVMALTSIASVAFADDANYGEAVTKAELQKYVDSFADFRETTIFDFGTTQADQFQDAIDYAENVLENDKSTANDYTAAYQMVKAVREGMTNHSSEELEALIKANQAIYDGNNILNEELNDNIYKTDKYQEFVDAFVDAENYVGSNDGRLTTDAWIALNDAVETLKNSELDKVTKSAFRATLKEYESIIASQKSYEGWRRGTCSVAPTTGEATNKGKVTEAKYVTFDQLMGIVYGGSNSTDATLVGGVAPVDDADAAAHWIDVGGKADVETYVKDEYGRFDEIKSSIITSDESIVGAYKAAKDAIDVFKGWEEDNTKRATKASVQTNLNKYHNKLVTQFASARAESLATAFGNETTSITNEKLIASKAGEIKVDKDTKLIGLDSSDDMVYDATVGTYTQKIAKNTDLLKYVPFLGSDVQAYLDSLPADPGDGGAAALAEKNNANAAKTTFDAAVTSAHTALENALKTISTDLVVEYDDDGKVDKIYLSTDDGKTNLKTFDHFDGTTTNAGADGKDIKTPAGACDTAIGTAVSNYNSAADSATATGVASVAADVAAKDAAYTAAMAAIAEAASGTITDLAAIMVIIEAYQAADYTADITALDENNTVAKKTGSPAEWTLINRKLTYVLNDLYPDSAVEDTYKKSDVAKLIEDAYQLAEDTGDAAVFADKHMDLVDARRAALEWLTAANAFKAYKEGDPVPYTKSPEYALPNAATLEDKNATAVYNALKGYYDDLNKLYDDYKISYNTIAAQISMVAMAIDNKAVDASDELVAALHETARCLSVLDAADIASGDENQAFDSDRTFLPNNRLHTDNKTETVDVNTDEKNLKAAYEKLLNLYDIAMGGGATTGKLGDANLDNEFDIKDVTFVLVALANDEADKLPAVANYDGIGGVDIKDVTAMLIALADM
ncbi:MAG: hypothetical protein J1F09_07920 [Oscillospiraceae bacterium]|nr:hypothetical protein [Oscillospiraceae bacterium]